MTTTGVRSRAPTCTPGYKAARPPEPEDLTPQFKLLREVLDRTGMLQAQTEGWEAEDAIGAFCLEASDDDRIDIVSGDRDLIQLVRDPVVRLLFTVRGVSELAEYDEAGVLAKYGVSASRYGEFAILRGDPSDGLPGVRGVGEKTARDLVVAFPSIDAMLEAAATGTTADQARRPLEAPGVARLPGHDATARARERGGAPQPVGRRPRRGRSARRRLRSGAQRPDPAGARRAG